MLGRQSKGSREALSACASRRGVRARIVPLWSGARTTGGGASKTPPREGRAGRWMREAIPEQSSPVSAEKAKQGCRDPNDSCNWAWVEAEVWTDRMLSALATASKGQPSLRECRAVRASHGLAISETVSMKKPPTGEPYAGKPPVRFGGRGRRKPIPTPISARIAAQRHNIVRLRASHSWGPGSALAQAREFGRDKGISDLPAC